MSTQPYRNVAYGLSEPLLNVAQAPIITQRDPTTKDRAQLGTEWINQSTDNIFILVKVEDNVSTWIQVGGSSGTITFDADSGSAVPSGGIITMSGAGDVSTSASGSTVTFTGSGVETLTTDSGNATASGNAITITGGNNISTTGAGSTVTIDVSGTTNHAIQVGNASGSLTSLGVAMNGQLPIGSTGLNPVLATLTAGAGISITNGAGSISIAALGSVPLTFDADIGSAIPAANTISMAGGTNISTTGAGSTVTFDLSGTIAVSNGGTGVSSFTPYAVICGGTISTNPLQSIASVGTAGQVLTSNGAGMLPTFQAASSGGIDTINGNTGSVTGSTVTITTPTGNGQGTAKFSGSGTTLTLDFQQASANLGIGFEALGSASLSGSGNSCYGSTSGASLTTGSENSFFGNDSGEEATTANSCSGIGSGVFAALTTGFSNSACGTGGFSSLTTGSRNCALGHGSGSDYTSSESDNICINNDGTVGESNTLRIGSGTGTGGRELNQSFIAGIDGIVVTGAAVLVSTSDQLGVASSSARFKSDIQDMKDDSSAIYKLRPVSFVWDKNSARGLKDVSSQRQYGLIAEEAYEHVPHAVVFDNAGKPFSINYNDLVGMLINEVQRLKGRIEALERK